ncbi:MAG: class II fructose-bisphosphate aldolase [Chloroflexi bacterium]|nr:class II fructose-bisphosphate aldolase [Chloroflexota bacterium]
MRARPSAILAATSAVGGAIPACNVYTLDQAAGVVEAAEATRSGLLLQVHPDGLGEGIWPLIAGLRVLADAASVPVAVHLDHCADPEVIARAIEAGVDGVMADGSRASLDDNARFVRATVDLAHPRGVEVEAELGRLSGTEDGLTVEAREARLTSPSDVPGFLVASGADLLAVSIGNVHGSTPQPPRLDLERLTAIKAAAPCPLVLHGGSGLDDAQLHAALDRGVRKVNVNTELRTAYRAAIGAATSRELVDVLAAGRAATRTATLEVIGRLRAAGTADLVGSTAPAAAEPRRI